MTKQSLMANKLAFWKVFKIPHFQLFPNYQNVFPRMPGGCMHQETLANRLLWASVRHAFYRYVLDNKLFQTIQQSFVNRFYPHSYHQMTGLLVVLPFLGLTIV